MKETNACMQHGRKRKGGWGSKEGQMKALR